MSDYKRFKRVMLSLFVAMIGGGVILQLLGGKPVKQMGWSLSSQSEVELSVKDPRVTVNNDDLLDQWQTVEVSYYPNITKRALSEGLTGALALDYHFVISDINGDIVKTRMWENQSIIQTINHYGVSAIRICLIGDPLSPRQTPQQWHSLERLLAELRHVCKKDFKVVRPQGLIAQQ